jgi:hypothetical protein
MRTLGHQSTTLQQRTMHHSAATHSIRSMHKYLHIHPAADTTLTHQFTTRSNSSMHTCTSVLFLGAERLWCAVGYFTTLVLKSWFPMQGNDAQKYHTIITQSSSFYSTHAQLAVYDGQLAQH